MNTPQEAFWRGTFGNEYTDRSADNRHVAGQIAFFYRALIQAHGVSSVLELGSNVGHNLAAIKQLSGYAISHAQLSAVEINAKAVQQLRQAMPDVEVHHVSLFDFRPDRTWDLVFTYGVLIHMPPDRLLEVYDLIHRASSRYVLLAEYYNPTAVEVPYRGHMGKLFKRDFAGEMLDRFRDLTLLDYGFVYHRDKNFPADDVTWFLLSKP